MPILRLEEEAPVDTHADEEIDEARLEAWLAERGLRKNKTTGEIEEISAGNKRRNTAAPQICSCGSFKCRMLSIYGLPVEVFNAEVSPLWPQPSRDAQAIKLRGQMQAGQ